MVDPVAHQLPPGGGGTLPTLGKAEGVTAILRFAGALLIVGTVTVVIEQTAGESAAYGFVILIILGYSAVGHRLDTITQFFQTTGITQGGGNG